jgi:DNA polymerase III alpha subunit
VLVRQRPGSAKGVMFITLEDETGIANLVVWPKVFEQKRRTILSAGMMAVRGRIQREGEVVHMVARRIPTFRRNSPASVHARRRFLCRMAAAPRCAMAAPARTRAKRRHAVCGLVASAFWTCTSTRSK